MGWTKESSLSNCTHGSTAVHVKRYLQNSCANVAEFSHASYHIQRMANISFCYSHIPVNFMGKGPSFGCWSCHPIQTPSKISLFSYTFVVDSIHSASLCHYNDKWFLLVVRRRKSHVFSPNRLLWRTQSSCNLQMTSLTDGLESN